MQTTYKEPVSGLFVRDKGDEGVIKQMKDYKTLMSIDISNPTILDLGGFIGTFAWFALNNLNPKQVVSVEPDPSNIEVFKQNFQNEPRVTLIEGACTKEGGQTLPLYLGKTYRSCNSLEQFRGRNTVDVNTVSFAELLETVKPDIIKCDIEGGEFGLDWTAIPACVRYIVMEIHQRRSQWVDQMKVIDQQLLEQGFTHVREPKHKVTFHKVDICSWKR